MYSIKYKNFYLGKARCNNEARSIFLFPRNLEIIGLDLANLSLTSTSKMSERNPTKVNC
jgi:hypothetical protein